MCKPLPIDREEYNLSNVGIRLIDIPQTCAKCGGGETKGAKTCQTCYGTGQETVTHVFDIIGQEYYPNVADFIEEARRMGISRRLELEDAKQYARLSSRSRLFFLHSRAIINNPCDLINEMKDIELERLKRAGCPKNIHAHPLCVHLDAQGCSALYWNLIEGGASICETDAVNSGADLDEGFRFVERKVARYLLTCNVKKTYK